MTFESSETAAKALSASPDDLVLDSRTLRLAVADTPKRGKSGVHGEGVPPVGRKIPVGGVPSGFLLAMQLLAVLSM